MVAVLALRYHAGLSQLGYSTLGPVSAWMGEHFWMGKSPGHRGRPVIQREVWDRRDKWAHENCRATDHYMVIGTLAVDGWAVIFGGAWAGCAPPSPLFAVPNVTAHSLAASVPTTYYLRWHYDCQCP